MAYRRGGPAPAPLAIASQPHAPLTLENVSSDLEYLKKEVKETARIIGCMLRDFDSRFTETSTALNELKESNHKDFEWQYGFNREVNERGRAMDEKIGSMSRSYQSNDEKVAVLIGNVAESMDERFAVLYGKVAKLENLAYVGGRVLSISKNTLSASTVRETISYNVLNLLSFPSSGSNVPANGVGSVGSGDSPPNPARRK